MMATTKKDYANISILKVQHPRSAKSTFQLPSVNLSDVDLQKKSTSDRTKRRVAHEQWFPRPVIRQPVTPVKAAKSKKPKKQKKPKITKKPKKPKAPKKPFHSNKNEASTSQSCNVSKKRIAVSKVQDTVDDRVKAEKRKAEDEVDNKSKTQKKNSKKKSLD